MKLIANFRNIFRPKNQREATESQAKQALPYQTLFSSLQQACANTPGGKVLVVTGNGEFTISLTWMPEAGKDTAQTRYRLDAESGAAEWREEKVVSEPDGTAQAAAIKEKAVREEPEKNSKQQRMMQRLGHFLRLNYAFRYNRLADRTECARLDAEEEDDAHHLHYTPVDTRTLNGIVLAAIGEGIDCWDRDVKRYIESDHARAYHPFTLYFDQLPAWDGEDRVSELARRVSDKELWVKSFHRWMLAVTATWMGMNEADGRANSVAPILISTRQGLGKSTFCRKLLPPALQDYFTESFDLTAASSAENKLATYGLINLDEFDRLPASRMPQLKNLMQMESLRIRRAYKRNAEPLPRIASFIGTSNRRDLLTDLTGSRRFVCVEVERPIDCTTPIDYEQLYAQLVQELREGERHWFSKEEEAAIEENNRAFYRVTPAEELVATCFRFAEPGEVGARLLSAADIYATLRRKNPAALRDCSPTTFSRLLAQIGRRVHTRYGNGYWVRLNEE